MIIIKKINKFSPIFMKLNEKIYPSLVAKISTWSDKNCGYFINSYILKIVFFALSKWPNFNSVYVLGVFTVFPMTVQYLWKVPEEETTSTISLWSFCKIELTSYLFFTHFLFFLFKWRLTEIRLDSGCLLWRDLLL